MPTIFNTKVKNLREKIRQQAKVIGGSRMDYGKLVDELYQLKPPFPEPRNGSEEEYEQDIIHIYDIIAHCIVADSSDLLNKYVIDPISKSNLIRQDKIHFYIDRFENYIETSKSTTEQNYYRKLIEIFKK